MWLQQEGSKLDCRKDFLTLWHPAVGQEQGLLLQTSSGNLAAKSRCVWPAPGLTAQGTHRDG